MNIFKQRLLNVAKALREAKRPEAFCMWGFSYQRSTCNPRNLTKHPCGTPMCALGHYASREDLQDAFRIDPVTGVTYAVTSNRDSMFVSDIFSVAQEHFGLSSGEVERLFGSSGCKDATSKTAAIRYILWFAARKWPERKRVRAKVKVREAVAVAA